MPSGHVLSSSASVYPCVLSSDGLSHRDLARERNRSRSFSVQQVEPLALLDLVVGLSYSMNAEKASDQNTHSAISPTATTTKHQRGVSLFSHFFNFYNVPLFSFLF